MTVRTYFGSAEPNNAAKGIATKQTSITNARNTTAADDCMAIGPRKRNTSLLAVTVRHAGGPNHSGG
jgi:hypothetical protein